MASLKFPLPLCDRCKKKVDRMKFEALWGIDGYRAIVFCHGDTESTLIPRQVLYNAAAVHPGVAFVKKTNG